MTRFHRVRHTYRLKDDCVPGSELLVSDAAKEIAARPQFTIGGIGRHVYVNGYDLSRIEHELLSADTTPSPSADRPREEER